MSEHEPESYLHLTRVAYRGRDRTNRSAPDVRIRLPELRMIKQIERFGSELHRETLERPKILEQRGIEIRTAWSKQNVAARIAVNKLRRREKCSRVEPSAERALAGRQIAIAAAIRTARRAGVHGRIVQLRREGKSGLRLQETVDLPTTQDRTRQALPAETWQPISHADGEPVANIEGGVAAIAKAALRVLRRSRASAKIGGNIVDRVRPGVSDQSGESRREALLSRELERVVVTEAVRYIVGNIADRRPDGGERAARRSGARSGDRLVRIEAGSQPPPQVADISYFEQRIDRGHFLFHRIVELLRVGL